jgi:hypothetical protein
MSKQKPEKQATCEVINKAFFAGFSTPLTAQFESFTVATNPAIPAIIALHGTKEDGPTVEFLAKILGADVCTVSRIEGKPRLVIHDLTEEKLQQVTPVIRQDLKRHQQSWEFIKNIPQYFEKEFPGLPIAVKMDQERYNECYRQITLSAECADGVFYLQETVPDKGEGKRFRTMLEQHHAKLEWSDKKKHYGVNFDLYKPLPSQKSTGYNQGFAKRQAAYQKLEAECAMLNVHIGPYLSSAQPFTTQYCDKAPYNSCTTDAYRAIALNAIINQHGGKADLSLKRGKGEVKIYAFPMDKGPAIVEGLQAYKANHAALAEQQELVTSLLNPLQAAFYIDQDQETGRSALMMCAGGCQASYKEMNFVASMKALGVDIRVTPKMQTTKKFNSLFGKMDEYTEFTGYYNIFIASPLSLELITKVKEWPKRSHSASTPTHQERLLQQKEWDQTLQKLFPYRDINKAKYPQVHG